MNKELILALKELEKERKINFEILLDVLKAALLSAYKKNFKNEAKPSDIIDIYIDSDSGDIKVLANLTVVERVTNPTRQISLEEARKIVANCNPGDVISQEVTPKDFGRIAAQTAKQVIVQRIREAEREIVFEEFIEHENDIVTGIVQRQLNGDIFVDLGKTIGVLPSSERIKGEFYPANSRIKAYVLEVKKTPRGPQVILSRTHPGFLKRLFEMEVPEIQEGIVEIKGIAREPGYRSKIAVYSSKKDVDEVGACVGPKGLRVQAIVEELKGEKIDIIKWSEDFKEFVANALSPAQVMEVNITDDQNSCQVIVPDHQLSLAIGKEGQNVRLAAKLTNIKIDIKTPAQIQDHVEANLSSAAESEPETEEVGDAQV